MSAACVPAVSVPADDEEDEEDNVDEARGPLLKVTSSLSSKAPDAAAAAAAAATAAAAAGGGGDGKGEYCLSVVCHCPACCELIVTSDL